MTRHFIALATLTLLASTPAAAQFVPANTTGQHWDVVHVGVLDHGSKRIFGVVGGELIAHMLFPELAQHFLGSRRVGAGLCGPSLLHDQLLSGFVACASRTT